MQKYILDVARFNNSYPLKDRSRATVCIPMRRRLSGFPAQHDIRPVSSRRIMTMPSEAFSLLANSMSTIFALTKEKLHRGELRKCSRIDSVGKCVECMCSYEGQVVHNHIKGSTGRCHSSSTRLSTPKK
jgi:hypothetical protein